MRSAGALAAVAVMTLCLPLAAADEYVVSGGVGSGAFSFRAHDVATRQQMSFREAGVEARRVGRVTFGLQVSLRADTVDEVESSPSIAIGAISIGGNGQACAGGCGGGGGTIGRAVVAGTRFRVAPFAEKRWGPVRARLGIVASSYYDPTTTDAFWILPMASVGVGSDEYHLELGLFDSPVVPSSADGGLGAAAIRTFLRLSPTHQVVVGIGSTYDGDWIPRQQLGGVSEGYLSYGYEGLFGNRWRISLGGYVAASETTGLYAALTSAL